MNSCVGNIHVEEHSCMNCLKKESSLLNELSFDELKMLDHDRSIANYKRGEIIYKEGSKSMGLLCLTTGKVKITRKAHNGVEQIVSLKKPVDFIDLHAIINDEPYKTTATALDDSSICIIEKKDFLKVIHQNPELSFKIIRSFSKELDDADSRFLNMTQKHLRARLADALILLADMYGTSIDGITLNCTMKRAELAAMSNMTTANVIRTLSDFSKANILTIDRRRVGVTDWEGLRNISESGA